MILFIYLLNDDLNVCNCEGKNDNWVGMLIEKF